jgi:hypothetical protein
LTVVDFSPTFGVQVMRRIREAFTEGGAIYPASPPTSRIGTRKGDGGHQLLPVVDDREIELICARATGVVSGSAQ